MAIRDKVTVRMRSGGKPFVSEVRRPGGKVEVTEMPGGFVRVSQLTRKGEIVDWAAFSEVEIKSIEYERGD